MTNHKTIISIICATYNRDRTIERAIRSVIDQNFNGWELLIVDDGSTDQTSLMVEKYLCDERIRYFAFQDNKGVGFARNFAISQALGDWVLLLDSDNALTPGALANMINVVGGDDGIEMHKFLVRNFQGMPMSDRVCETRLLNVYEYLAEKLSGEFHTFVKRKVLERVRFYEQFNGGEGIVWSKIALRNDYVKFHPIFTLEYDTHGDDRLSRRSKRNISRLANVYRAEMTDLWLSYLYACRIKLLKTLAKFIVYNVVNILMNLSEKFYRK